MMIGYVLLFTNRDGGVGTCAPEAMEVRDLSAGGRFGTAPARGVLDREIEKHVAGEIKADVARRYIHALQFGGLTEAYALEHISDKDVGDLGTAVEKVWLSDLPSMWFRPAWRRSKNGGPISIDLDHARQVQWSHIASHVMAENKRRMLDLFGKPQIDVERLRDRIGSLIQTADDEDDLRLIWPEELQ